MSIREIITAGFGTFGTIKHIVTRGFEIGAAIIDVILRRQGSKHFKYNSLHGGAFRPYNSDLIAGMLADEPSIAADASNGVMFEWLGLKGQTETTLSGRLQGFADNNAAFNWTSLGTFS